MVSTILCNITLTSRYTAFKDHIALQDYEINDGMVSSFHVL